MQGIVYVDHQKAVFEHAQGALRDGAEFAVGDEDFCLSMRELEGDRLGVEADVQSVQHGAGHGHAEMRFIDRRHVRRENGDGVARPDAMPRQGGREPAAAVVGLCPGAAPRAVDKRDPMRMDRRRLRQEAQRRQRRIVRRPLAETIPVGTRPFRARFEDGGHWRSPKLNLSSFCSIEESCRRPGRPPAGFRRSWVRPARGSGWSRAGFAGSSTSASPEMTDDSPHRAFRAEQHAGSLGDELRDPDDGMNGIAGAHGRPETQALR